MGLGLITPVDTSRRSVLVEANAVINTARGGLFDELALANALRFNQINEVGFDVVSQEPPPQDHPITLPMDLPNFF